MEFALSYIRRFCTMDYLEIDEVDARRQQLPKICECFKDTIRDYFVVCKDPVSLEPF